MAYQSNYASAMQEAMEAIARAASTAGVSMKEAAAALQSLSIISDNANLARLITENGKKQSQEYREVIAPQKTKAETKNPYLADFEIPHYDFEDMNIKDLIDF